MPTASPSYSLRPSVNFHPSHPATLSPMSRCHPVTLPPVTLSPCCHSPTSPVTLSPCHLGHSVCLSVLRYGSLSSCRWLHPATPSDLLSPANRSPCHPPHCHPVTCHAATCHPFAYYPCHPRLCHVVILATMSPHQPVTCHRIACHFCRLRHRRLVMMVTLPACLSSAPLGLLSLAILSHLYSVTSSLRFTLSPLSSGSFFLLLCVSTQCHHGSSAGCRRSCCRQVLP